MALTTRFRRVWNRTPLDQLVLLLIIGCCVLLFLIQNQDESDKEEAIENSNLHITAFHRNLTHKHHKRAVNPSHFLPPIRILYPTKQSSKFTNQDRIPGRFNCAFQTKSFNNSRTNLEDLENSVTDSWKLINSQNDSFKFLIYSAYFDDRSDPPSVKVIAVTLGRKRHRVHCRLKFQDETCYDVESEVQIMTEHWKLKYASFFITCPLPSTYSVPFKVALSTNKSQLQNAIEIPVHWNVKNNISQRSQIALCVKPIHYLYNQGIWFVEFIEAHRLLGVNHFYFYNHTVGSDVQNILVKYIRDGVVSVLPWQLGLVSQKEIRTEGMFAAFNDCLYRTMHLFKYTVMVDLDELIVPGSRPDYLTMLHYLEEVALKNGMKASSFMVRNAFFYLYWENDTTAYGEEPEKPPRFLPYLLTQYKTRRTSETMKYGSRSKLIVIPDKVFEVGNHNVWKNVKGYRTIPVSEDVAILHHYRICEFGGYACLNKSSVVDHSALRFNSTLLKRVQKQCADIFPERGRCPVAPSLGSPW